MPTSRSILSKPSGSPSPATQASLPAGIPCCKAASSAPFSVSIHFLQLPRSATCHFPPAPLQLSSPTSATAAQVPQAALRPLGEYQQPPAQLLPPTLIFLARPRGGFQPAPQVTWQHHQPRPALASLATGAQHPAERGDMLQRADCGQAGQGQEASPMVGRQATRAQPAHSAWGQSATTCLIRHREKFNKPLSAVRWEWASTTVPLPAPSPPPPGATPHTKETAGEDSRVPRAMVPGCMSRAVPQLCRAPLPPASCAAHCSLPIPTGTPVSSQ